jgi:hypothetical protein
MADNVTFIDVPNGIVAGTTTFAIIDLGNGNFQSMLKSDYDAQQAAQANPTPQA